MSYLLPSPLPVANGGTGSTTNEGVRNTFGAPQNATVKHASILSLQVAGTITGASYTAGSAVLTFTSSSVTLVPGMSLSILTSAVIKTVDSPTQVTMTVVFGTTGSGTASVYNSTISTLVSSSIITIDGRTMAVGDIVILTVQSTSAQNGPWVISSLAGSVMSFVRPSYWSGTIYGSALFYIQQGTSYHSQVVAVSGAISTGSVVGLDSFGVFTAISRGVNALTSSNTFNGKQTFQANAAGSGAVPFAFQAGSLMTTPQAHSVEWDGTNEYVSSGAQFTASISGTTMTVTGTPTGVIQVGMLISGTNVTAGTTITAAGTGIGAAGTYTVSTSQTVSSTTITGTIRCIIGTFVNGAVGGSGAVPASSAAIGRPGQLAFDSTGFYVCTASNTWRKVALTTF